MINKIATQWRKWFPKSPTNTLEGFESWVETLPEDYSFTPKRCTSLSCDCPLARYFSSTGRATSVGLRTYFADGIGIIHTLCDELYKVRYNFDNHEYKYSSKQNMLKLIAEVKNGLHDENN